MGKTTESNADGLKILLHQTFFENFRIFFKPLLCHYRGPIETKDE